ncbi:DUF2723 domain-containing protein [Flammeovirgaceae bacterium SG7u.111]|nr:DUF2723 domain-containing protein [Flammeovirgaceae bacterium SG7u.132]WPO37444.1 DUF2723 domain-containing protein [Flammeovirgaceae bacterium SG7u.111]
MKQFNRVNNITGWAVFILSTIVYWLTVEETASFWDCGEFIAVSYKLEVPHPPGAPLYLLLGRMFSFLAMGDGEQVAYWINILSVLSSSFTILFLHWTIVLLGRKLIQPTNGQFSMGQLILLMGAGVVGSLAYTFSDSFWFSAAEAEVYALSSLFTAFVFWAILKWELIENKRYANQWIIMIAYVMGLSIGVHLLNLVTIPALALIVYFKRYEKTTQKGVIASLLIGLVIIVAIMYGVIPGLPSVAGWFEIMFVNSFGLPFSTGIVFFMLLVVVGLGYGVYYSEKNKKEILNTVLLSLTFILIGYASYGIIVIRSNFNPPIDENNPEDVISFVRYLKREQYGNRPLLYGNTYEAKRTGIEQLSPIYRKAGDKYEVYDHKTKATYDKNILLPRIYSQQPGHVELYKQWMNLKPGESPNMVDNIYYMFRYQLGHMYFRYFMWNFAGREGDDKEAKWMVPWEDIGKELPEEIARNKARDNFYMLPLILGLIGFFFQLRKDKKNFWVVTLLFFLTGIALVLYLNSPPVEPRERDYIYVGSFYAFAIWIGLGVMQIAEWLKKAMGSEVTVAAVSGVLCITIPIMMGAKGWDNHNRSNRFHSVDQAKNTLRSCAPNAILFTGGDNDTFPLWYVQEVEGFRTDVRVVVLSYFSTDWYIDQMRRKINESEALPFSISQVNYLQGKNDYVPFVPDQNKSNENGAVNLKAYINLVEKGDSRVQVGLQDGSYTAKLLTKAFALNIDSAGLIQQGIIPKGKEDRVESRMVWRLKEGANAIFKNDLAILDLMVTNNWERPIYFNNTSANTSNLDLRPYLQLEGMAYRLLPIRVQGGGEVGEVNTDVMMANMKEFEFRGFEDASVYHDEEYRKFGSNTRNSYARLVQQLINEGRDEEALEMLDEAMENIPDRSIPYSYFTTRFVELYHTLGEDEKAEQIAETLSKRGAENLEFWLKNRGSDDMLRQKSMLYLNQLLLIYRRLDETTKNEVKRLEQMQVAMDEGGVSEELEEARQKETYFAEQSRKYYELFYKYMEQVEGR